MIGPLGPLSAMAAGEAQRKEAAAYRALARAAMQKKTEASERAAVEIPYIAWLRPPDIRQIGDQWFAIIEAGPSVPKVEKRA